jgi:hypothetical protein
MSRLATYRALWCASLASGAPKKFAKLGIQFLALCDEFFNSRDLAIYFHAHHLLLVTPRYHLRRSLVATNRETDSDITFAMGCYAQVCSSMRIIHILLRSAVRASQ